MTTTNNQDIERLRKLYKQYLSDINITPTKGKTRHETAWDLAYKRYRQAKNNELALSMSPSTVMLEKVDNGKERIPPRPNLTWKKKTSRWVSAKSNPLKVLQRWKKQLDREAKRAERDGNKKLYEKLTGRVNKVSEKLEDIDFPEIVNTEGEEELELEKQRAKRITPIKTITPIKRAKRQTATTPEGKSVKSNLNLYRPPKFPKFRPGAGASGLVEREITVRRKDGTTYKRKQKVRPENA